MVLRTPSMQPSMLAGQGILQPSADGSRLRDGNEWNGGSSSTGNSNSNSIGKEKKTRLHRAPSGSLTHLLKTLPKVVSCTAGGIMKVCSRKLPGEGDVNVCQRSRREDKSVKGE